MVIASWSGLSFVSQQGLTVLAPGRVAILLVFLSLILVALQGSEVVDQVLHTVSKSNSLEELTLENAGLKSYVSLLVSPDRRLLLLNLIWPSCLLLTLSPVWPPHSPLWSSSLLSHLTFPPALSSSPWCCLLDLSFPLTHSSQTFVHLFSHNQIISPVCLWAFLPFIC